jgi:hypothetical protein
MMGAGPEAIPRAAVAREGLSFTAVREHTFTNLTDPAVLDGSRPAVQRRRMTYRYQAPLTATLLLEYLDAEGWQFLTFVVTPEDERACRVYQTADRYASVAAWNLTTSSAGMRPRSLTS